jgi:ribosome-associated translation inhibitor RaiA
MTQDVTLVIRFKEIEHDDDVHADLERRLRHLTETFPETSHCELSLTADGLDISAHAQARGRGIDLASHASAQEARAAGEAAIDKLERELRREHDKRIFSRRREARRDQDRRRET